MLGGQRVQLPALASVLGLRAAACHSCCWRLAAAAPPPAPRCSTAAAAAALLPATLLSGPRPLQLPWYPPSLFGANDGKGHSLVYYFALPEGWEPSQVGVGWQASGLRLEVRTGWVAARRRLHRLGAVV